MMKDYKTYTLKPGIETEVFNGSGLYYCSRIDSISSLVIIRYSGFYVYGSDLSEYRINVSEGIGKITYEGIDQVSINVKKLAINY